MVTINQLLDVVCETAGKNVIPVHDLTKPQGVRGRNSDNSLLREVLGWSPSILIKEGMNSTYGWIWRELERQGRAVPPRPSVLGIANNIKNSI